MCTSNGRHCTYCVHGLATGLPDRLFRHAPPVSWPSASPSQPDFSLCVFVNDAVCPPPPPVLTLVSHNYPCEIFITNACTSRRIDLAIKRKVLFRFDRFVVYRAFLKFSALLLLRLLKDLSLFVFQGLDARESRPLRERI